MEAELRELVAEAEAYLAKHYGDMVWSNKVDGWMIYITFAEGRLSCTSAGVTKPLVESDPVHIAACAMEIPRIERDLLEHREQRKQLQFEAVSRLRDFMGARR